MQLEVSNISKVYLNKIILSDFNVKINQGEIVSLIGPNGSGKTTSFNIIAGISHSTSGLIKLGDKKITNYPLYMRSKLGIGYLQQQHSIFEKLTVEQNLLIALESKFDNKIVIQSKMEKILNDFNLNHLKKCFGFQLSGGEKRKVEIARIMSIEPIFLLLDEPFIGIDPINIDDIKNILIKMTKNNIGIFISDHHIYDILDISNNICFLFEGKILFKGTKEEIINNPDLRKIYFGNNFFKKN